MPTLGRTSIGAPGSPTPMLGFNAGVLGVMAGMFWFVSRDPSDPTLEYSVVSIPLIAAVGLGWFFRHLGAWPSTVPPATAAVCMGVIVWLGLDQPLAGHDWFGLGCVAALLSVSVVFASIFRGRASTPSVLFALARDVVVENDGVQWLMFPPPSKLCVGNNPRFMILLENCHDHERRVTAEIREIGTALIGGRDRVQRSSITVALPANGFAEVRLPVVVGSEGPANVYLWINVTAAPRGLRGRSKPRVAASGPRYRPLLSAWLLRVDDPRQLGLRFFVDATAAPQEAPAEPSARVIDEAQLRERFSQAPSSGS